MTWLLLRLPIVTQGSHLFHKTFIYLFSYFIIKSACMNIELLGNDM